MTRYECTTQADLDAAVAKAGPLDLIACIGDGWFTVGGSSRVEARGSSRVEARGSSRVVARESSRVEAWGSSRVEARGSSRVEARGSSRVEAWGSSRVVARGSSRVEARGSSRVEAWGSSRVVARESSSVEAWGSSRVEASKYVAVQTHGSNGRRPNVTGGVLIEIPTITTAADFCDYYGIEVKRGIAVLYKAVDDDYSTDYARRADIAYIPGAKPEAPDWDPHTRCGEGLHLSPHPVMALQYNDEATRFVACPVKIADIVVISDGGMPDKVKVPRIARAVYEVDRDGVAVGPQ